MSNPWDDKWWLDRFGDDAEIEWATTQLRLLTESQRSVMRNGLGHASSERALIRRGLLTPADGFTEAGEAVRRAMRGPIVPTPPGPTFSDGMGGGEGAEYGGLHDD
jgi:hypothetical protein